MGRKSGLTKQVPRPGAVHRLFPVRVAVALGVFAAFLIVSAAGYYFIEGDYTWLDALYMTVITVGTVGYHVVGKAELSDPGKAWTMFVILGGLTSGGVAMSLVVAALVEGRIRGMLGRRQLERRIAALRGHVIVCGYGHMGRHVARSLREAGRKVVVIDVDPQRTSVAEEDKVPYVLGDAQEEGTLEAAGLQRAAVVIAVLRSDAENVFVTLSARGLNPAVRVIARAREVATEDKLARAGAQRVICPQVIGANRIVDVVLRPAMVDFVEMAHQGVELEMDQLTVEAQSDMLGRTLQELALPSRVGAMVVAVRRAGGEAVYNPGPAFRLEAGDKLILIGRRGMAVAVDRLCRGGGPGAGH